MQYEERLIKGKPESGTEDESARGQLTITWTQTQGAQLLPLTLMFGGMQARERACTHTGNSCSKLQLNA